MRCPECGVKFHTEAEIDNIEEYGCCTHCSGEEPVHDDDEE